MTPSTEYALAALIMGLAALGFAGLSIWCARRALRMAKAAAFWQQESGRNAEDAGKYRVARAARAKSEAARSAPLATLKAQTTNALASGK